MCVDVQVKGFVMCLAVCESGRHWVLGLCLGCVCVGCCPQGGWAKGGAWSSKISQKTIPSFFPFSHMNVLFLTVFSHSFISYLWNGVSVSTCRITPFFFTFHLSVLLHTTAFFQSYFRLRQSHTHNTHIHILANTLSLINTSYLMESTPHNCPEFDI